MVDRQSRGHETAKTKCFVSNALFDYLKFEEGYVWVLKYYGPCAPTYNKSTDEIFVLIIDDALLNYGNEKSWLIFGRGSYFTLRFRPTKTLFTIWSKSIFQHKRFIWFFISVTKSTDEIKPVFSSVDLGLPKFRNFRPTKFTSLIVDTRESPWIINFW